MTNQQFLVPEQENLLKAVRYSNYLKREQVRASGINVDEILKQQKARLAEVHNLNMLVLSTEETMEEDRIAYEGMKVAVLDGRKGSEG